MNPVIQNQRVGILEQYAQLKLQLAGIVLALLQTVEQRRDGIAAGECRRVLARLAEDRFNLAILGQFSRGKSSLMNALLGAEKLPTGILPLTSVITTVMYGDTEKVLIQREGWTFPQEIRLDQLTEYVTQNGNPGNEKRVTLAQIQLPHEMLRLGVHFIDTPGVASMIRENTRTTRQFLPEADAAILVTSFESPMTETELSFLREIREHVRKVFVVVNKQDLVASSERAGVLEAVRENLREVFEDAGFELFALSARDALLAKQEGSGEALAASGLPLLEQALTKFLRTEKARELLSRTADRVVSLARQQEISIRISQRARSPEEAANSEHRLQESLERIAHERALMIQRLGNRLRLQYPKCCDDQIGLWNSEDETYLASEWQKWFFRDGEIVGQAFEEFFRRLSQKLFSEWISRHRQELEAVFHSLTDAENSAIANLEMRIWSVPADVLAEEDRVDPSQRRSIETPPLNFREIDVPVREFKVPWWYDVIPEGRPREFIARHWLKRIPEFVRLYRRSACSTLEMAVDDWVSALDRQFLNRIEGMSSQIAMLLRDGRKSADLPEVDQTIGRIQSFVEAVRKMGSEGTPSEQMALSQADGSPHARSISQCSICLRLERTLWEFMARCQYELSVNETAQRQHALRSGFCPLHTWQYETIASPQGVCAAYPEVLTHLAEKLRGLAEDSTSVQSMDESLRSILPKQTSCAACELLASEEKAAADQLVRRITGDDQPNPALCAFHLHSVLAAAPGLKAAQRLLLEQAQVFERLAEDMQNYALNHTAVRRHLSTQAESQSAIAGLSHLVGSQRLAGPWRIE